jgi:6-phospho-beta-glucosidase
VKVDGKECIHEIFGDAEIFGIIPGKDTSFYKAVGGYPSSYLNYYYNREKTVEAATKKRLTRGEECVAIEETLLKLYSDESLVSKPTELEKRGGAFYSEAAVSLIEAIENDLGTLHVLNTDHRGTLPFLQNGEVAEVKCRVTKTGITPLPLMNPEIHPHITGYIQAVKAYEKLTVQAALSGDYSAGLSALLSHPLVGDFQKAKAVYDEMLIVHRPYLERFN